MKLFGSFLAFASGLDGPGSQNNFVAFGLPAENAYPDAFNFDDGKARPSSNWKPSGGQNGNKPTQKPLKTQAKQVYKPPAYKPAATKKPYQKPYKKPTKKPYKKPKTTRKPYQKPTKKPYQKPTKAPYVKPTKAPYVKPTNNPYVKPPAYKPAATKKPYVKPTTKKPYYPAPTKATYKPVYKPVYKPTTKAPPKYTTPKDVNECYLGTDKCHYNAKCVNTLGGYNCICTNGYTGNGYSCVAKDVDECNLGTDKCDPYAKCTNTIGAYTCSCNKGYEGNGYSCKEEPVNECLTGANNCSRYAQCIDKSWGFICKCNNGYEGDGVDCTEKYVDPCKTYPCHDKATCAAGQYAGYTCTCPAGYSGNGIGSYGCVDIDECYSGADDCASGATCLNSQGGYNCACQNGYSGNGYSCEQDDVDECYMGTDNCASNAICTNTDTGFSCACPTGWSGDGLTCYEDAPPVESCGDYNPCSGDATCMDTSNGPTCMCGKGYKGNGRLFESTDEQKAKPVWSSSYDTNSGAATGGAYTGGSTDDSTGGAYTGGSTGGSTGGAYTGGSTGGSTGDAYTGGSTGGSTGGGYTGGSTGGDTGGAGSGCDDVDECAMCGIGGTYNMCPCQDPTPICSNTAGGYTCGIDTAFGDPHFRVTAPGQLPVCFDVDTPSGAILDLYSDAQTSLEINAQFKNVHNGKKQFIKAIGFTSREGLQMALTPDKLEVYENGQEFITYNITSDIVDERMFDCHVKITPADHETRHNRHTVDVTMNDGEKFRFAVKPGAGSLSFELEGTHGIKSPTGLIGQFTNPGSYSIDENNNILAGAVHIPSADRAWHSEHQCHQISAMMVEPFLGRPIRDYQVTNLFASLFFRGPSIQIIDDDAEIPK